MKKISNMAKVIFARLACYLSRHQNFYIGVVAALGYAQAASLLLDPSVAFADIDSKGHSIHRKVVSVGKWVIAIKGSIETIQSVLNSDYQTAKVQFFQYLFVFAILLFLPYCLVA